MIKVLFLCLALQDMSVHNSNIVCENLNYISKYSLKNKVDPLLLTSILWVESRFTPNAKSRGGACGISQVLPKYSISCEELMIPENGIREGARIFGLFFNNYAKKNISTGLCAYNAGYRCKKECEKIKEKCTSDNCNKYEKCLFAKKGGQVYAKEVIKFHNRLRKKYYKQKNIYNKKTKLFVTLLKSYFNNLL